MTNVLASAAQWLASEQKRLLATAVVYQATSAEAPVVMTARIASSVYEVESSEGRVERWESRDYTCDPADFQAHPVEGDTFVETYGNLTLTYRVMAPPGLPPVHYADPYKTSLLVHTKLVATEVGNE